jgi:hypothetical protein
VNSATDRFLKSVRIESAEFHRNSANSTSFVNLVQVPRQLVDRSTCANSAPEPGPTMHRWESTLLAELGRANPVVARYIFLFFFTISLD